MCRAKTYFFSVQITIIFINWYWFYYKINVTYYRFLTNGTILCTKYFRIINCLLFFTYPILLDYCYYELFISLLLLFVQMRGFDSFIYLRFSIAKYWSSFYLKIFTKYIEGIVFKQHNDCKNNIKPFKFFARIVNIKCILRFSKLIYTFLKIQVKKINNF